MKKNAEKAVAKEQVEGYRKRSSFMITCQAMSKNKGAMAGLVILIIIVALAILAPVIAPYRYDEVDVLHRLEGPSKEHILGTDQLGRDIFSRILYGAKYSLSIGALVVICRSLVGVVIGAIAGFFGNAVDAVIMRIMDIMSAIPSMLLAIVLAAIFGGGYANTILALTISGIPNVVRIVRASFLSIRKMEYVEAAECINCSNTTIMFKHLLPNAFAPLLVASTMDIAGAILVASSLSFIGLGVQPPLPEWGAMLSDARNYMLDYPYLILAPGIVIMITVLSFNLLGDALRDALDPNLRK